MEMGVQNSLVDKANRKLSFRRKRALKIRPRLTSYDATRRRRQKSKPCHPISPISRVVNFEELKVHYILQVCSLWKTIGEIRDKRENFLRQVKSANEILEEGSKKVPWGQLWKLEPLNYLSAIKGKITDAWDEQEKMCWSYMKGKMNDGIIVESFGKLANDVVQIIRDLERMRCVESCDVNVVHTDGEFGLGKIGLSASPGKTTVTVDERSAANELNSCTVTVRDVIGSVVKEGTNYEITALLLDPEDKPMDITIENKKNGLFCVKYFPTVTGRHTLWVTLNSLPISTPMLDINVEGRTRPNLTIFGEPGKSKSQLAKPWGVCTDDHGRIYISDRCNHRIQIFDKKGEYIREFGEEGSNQGQFKVPAGITVNMSRLQLIVADKDNHRIQIFTLDGEFVRQFGKYEKEEDSLNYPWDVTVDGRGGIAVTEGYRRRVTLFDDNGNKLHCIFKKEMDLEFPRGIVFVPEKKGFLVTDFNKHKIVLLNEELTPVATLGSRKLFNRPQGIAVSGNGFWAVADCQNKCIKVFLGGTLYRVIQEDFDCIQDIAYHPDGSLIVVEKAKCQVIIISF